MNGTNLIKEIAKRTRQHPDAVRTIMRAFEDVVFEELASGGRISMRDFLTLEVRHRAARTKRNLRTEEPIQVPEHKVVYAIAGAALRKRIQ